jgi:hypothetical protein
MSIARRSILIALVVLGGSLVLGSTPVFAFAFPEAEFGGTYIPIGSLEVPTPTGIAVEASTGDVFVVSVVKNEEEGEAKVLKLSPEGVVLGKFSVPGFSDGVKLSWGVAVDNSCYLQGKTGTACEEFDPSNGDVYVTNIADGSGVERFRPRSGEPNVYEDVEVSLPTEERGGTGVAVDSSGNVYASVFGFHGAIFKFNSKGEPLSSLSGENWEVANGVAVDEAGNVFVPNINFSFEPEGVFELNAEAQLLCPAVAGKAVAVDPASGEVFVLDGQGGPVTRYRSACSEANVEHFGEFSEAADVAYSSNNHDLYVTDYRTGEVHIYARGTPGPAPEATCQAPGEIATTSVALACSVTPNSSETTWQFEYRQAGTTKFNKAPMPAGHIAGAVSSEEVKDTIGGLQPQTEYDYRLAAENEHGVTRFPAEGTLSFTTLQAVPASACSANATGEGATLEATLTPRVPGAEYHFQYGTSESYGSSTQTKVLVGAGEVKVRETVGGLEPNKVYDCRVVAQDSEGTTLAENGTFTTKLVSPALIDVWSSEVGVGSARLFATIDPQNSETTYSFEYVQAASYCASCVDPYEHGQKVPLTPGVLAADVGYHTVQQELANLQWGTTYRYRIVAENQAGPTYREGELTTAAAPGNPPGLTTGAASAVTQSTASVSGSVNGEGYATGYVFELGTTSGVYSTRVYGSAGPGAEAVSVALQGLAPGTTYHYRLVASNANGTTDGEEATFTTSGYANSLAAPPTPALIATPVLPTVQEEPATPSTKEKTTKKHKKKKKGKPGKRTRVKKKGKKK